MAKTVLITGATGFVASNLIPKLVKRGYKVKGLIRGSTTPEKIKKLILIKCEPAKATNSKQLDELCKDAFAIINLAGILNEDASRKRSHRRVSSFLQHLLRSAKKHKVAKIVHLSALGSGKSKYINSKQSMEEHIKRSGINDYTILKASIIMGRGCDFIERVQKLITKTRIPAINHGEIQPIYIGDIVKYLIKAMENKRYKNTVFEVAGPQTVTIKELIEKIARKMNKPIKTVSVPIKLARVPVKLMDIFTAYPLITSTELDLIQNSKEIYSSKAAHQFGIKLTNLSETIEKSIK